MVKHPYIRFHENLFSGCEVDILQKKDNDGKSYRHIFQLLVVDVLKEKNFSIK
jgi:hypothetical protein